MQDISTFYQNGVRGFFIECEKAHTTSFHSLKTWLGSKLLQDSIQDREALIDDFMQGYYGPAAKKMKDYMDYMEDAIQSITERIERADSTAVRYTDYFRPFLTLDYIEACQHFLDEAEKLVNPESIYALHLRRERIPVDLSLLSLWDRLERYQAPGTIPFDKETLIERYYNYRKEQQEHRETYGFQSYYPFPDVGANLDLEYEALVAENPPLPLEFQNIPDEMLIDICWQKMLPSHIDRIVYDDDAVSDKAYAGYVSVPISETEILTLYMYDNIGKVISAYKNIDLASVPRDNKYYWYEIGTCEIKPTMLFVSSRGPFYLFLDPVIDPNRDIGEKYKIYVSLKVSFGTGIRWPQLGRSQNKPDVAVLIESSVLVDRIILVNSRYDEDHLAYWKFDEEEWSGITGKVADSSGNEHHGTAMNGANTTSDAKLGRAAFFDGIDDYIKISYDFPDADITVMGWFKTTGDQMGTIFDKHWGHFRILFNNSNKQLDFVCQTTTDYHLLSSPVNSIQLGQWYHFAAVSDNTNSKMFLYINGELTAERTVTGTFVFGSYDITIGSTYWGSCYPFEGVIDEIRILQKALIE